MRKASSCSQMTLAPIRPRQEDRGPGPGFSPRAGRGLGRTGPCIVGGATNN